jgi:hypothetical protein
MISPWSFGQLQQPLSVKHISSNSEFHNSPVTSGGVRNGPKAEITLQFLSEGYTVAVSRRLTNMLEMDSRTASRFWLVKAKELTEFV